MANSDMSHQATQRTCPIARDLNELKMPPRPAKSPWHNPKFVTTVGTKDFEKWSKEFFACWNNGRAELLPLLTPLQKAVLLLRIDGALSVSEAGRALNRYPQQLSYAAADIIRVMQRLDSSWRQNDLCRGLQISPITQGFLESHGIYKVSELLKFTAKELRVKGGFGAVRIQEIKAALAKRQLKLRSE